MTPCPTRATVYVASSAANSKFITVKGSTAEHDIISVADTQNSSWLLNMNMHMWKFADVDQKLF